MMDTPVGAVTDLKSASSQAVQEHSAEWLRTRNAELVNSNRLLIRQLADRNHLEMTMHESELSFRGLAESNVLGVMFARPDGTITNANVAFLRMLGYSREEITAGRLRWRDINPSGNVFEKGLGLGACGPTKVKFVMKGGRTVELVFGIARVKSPAAQILGFFLEPPEDGD
jgi:PAS domain S-box-containing protein